MVDEAREPEKFSILDRVIPFEWDYERVSNFEAAIDGIHRIIGDLSALDWRERQSLHPNADLLDRISERTLRFVQIRKELVMTNDTQIRAVREMCNEILVRGGIEAELQRDR